MTSNTQGIVGRGNAEGARLFREWFDGLTKAAGEERTAAYVFVMGSLAELLRCFDFPIVCPEINSLQTAVRHVAHEYLDQAEDYGYSPDICGYVKADVATQLRGGALPMGRIPKPGLAVLTNACNTYVKWGEIWERMYGMPAFVLDIPGSRAADLSPKRADGAFENDLRYVVAQLQELIAVCEQVSGIRFDVDRLRENMTYANTMSRGWSRVLQLNQSRPAVFNALTDGTIFMGVGNTLRGTPEGAQYFDELVEEMEYKRVHGIGTLTEELHRLIFVGVPCYPMFRRFGEMFSEWGGAFVNSTYLWFASGGAHAGYQYDTTAPLESLAEGLMLSVRSAMDSMFFQTAPMLRMIDEFAVDGVVYHPIKSCRTVSTGLADSRRDLMQRADIASLFIESDMMDRRVVSEAQLKNRIDAFFEGLTTRKQQALVAG